MTLICSQHIAILSPILRNEIRPNHISPKIAIFHRTSCSMVAVNVESGAYFLTVLTQHETVSGELSTYMFRAGPNLKNQYLYIISLSQYFCVYVT